VIAACGRESQRELAIGQLKIQNFTTDYHELLRSPEIDLVLVLTSMIEHGPVVQTALEAGKHVLVEKPIAVSLEEAARIVELSKRSRGYLVCAPCVTLSPTYKSIGRRVQSGAIGKIFSARARYGWSGPWWNEWFYAKGGGCLFDLGVYSLTSLTGLLGPARRVMAMTGIAIPERIVNGRTIPVAAEDNAQVLLDFGNAVFGVVTTGFTIQQYRTPAFELYGRRGTLQMLGDDWAPEGYELWQNEKGCWQVYKETNLDWHWTDGLRHIVDCIRQSVRPDVTPEHALHVLEIMLKAQTSGQEGRAIELETAFPITDFGPELESEAAHLVHDRTRKEFREP
jgi:predicted dehydrogenase